MPNSNINYYDFLKLQGALLRMQDKICCIKKDIEFGTTELNPPIIAPGEDEPTVLINLTEGLIWYWDGDSWESFVSGGGGSFGVTLLSPPVAAPIGDDPTVLINLTTGVIYYWDGDSWEIANDPDTNTNFANTNLTLTGNRLHDADGNNLSITDIQDLLLEGDGNLLIRWADGVGDPAYISLSGGAIIIQCGSGADTISFSFSPGVGLTVTESSGRYFINSLTDDNTVLPVITDLKKDQFGISIDEGAVVSAGYKTRLRVPYNGTIVGWTILETSETPIAGDIEIVVRLGTYANYDTTPTFTDISGTEEPTLTNAVANQDLTLSTWTTDLVEGDLIEFEVVSATDVEKIYLAIHTLRD
jgi:hypothetical protein